MPELMVKVVKPEGSSFSLVQLARMKEDSLSLSARHGLTGRGRPNTFIRGNSACRP